MAMTRQEAIAKQQVMKVLAKSGYPTYARLLDEFDVNLTNDPGVVGYMEPGKARIVLNRGLDIDQVSVIVRHEILHEYLSHQMRMEKKLGKDVWDNRTSQMHQNSNIAGDYEISNRGYTEEDKEIARAIKLNGQVLQGLVTEDQHPDWVDLSLEDMYDKLTQEQKKDQQQQTTPNIGDRGNKDIQDLEDAERKANDISNQMQDQQQSSSSQEQDDEDSDEGEGAEGEQQDGEGQEGSQSGDQQSSNQGEQQSGDQSPEGDAGSDEQGLDSNSEDQSADSSSPSDSESGGPSQSKSKNPSSDRDKKAKQIQNAADNIKNAAKNLEQEIEQEMEQEAEDAENGEVFKDAEDAQKSKDIEARLNKIKELLNDTETAAQIFDETDTQVSKSRTAKAARDADRYRNSPIARFTASMNQFLKSQISNERNKTWKKFNKTYANSNIIRQGTGRTRDNKIPVINVYFDQSGSWDDDKIKVGEQAIGTLNNYVRKNQIKINLFYFSNNVHSDKWDARREGGTNGQPILDHIQQTKPDNVIVMTDSDISDCTTDITVPGAVWFLWKGGISQNLKDHLHGKMSTKSFELE